MSRGNLSHHSKNFSSKTFFSGGVKSLRVHLQQDHTETQCHYCDKEFSNSSVLNDHIDVVHTIEPGDDDAAAAAATAAANSDPVQNTEDSGVGASGVASGDKSEKGEAGGGGGGVGGSHRCLECPMTLARLVH